MANENDPKISQASKEEMKRKLHETDHVLADAISGLTEDVSELKTDISGVKGQIAKLYTAVIGDSEFQVKGVIAKGKEGEERLDRIEERLSKRIAALEAFRRWVCGSAAGIALMYAIFGDAIRKLMGLLH